MANTGLVYVVAAVAVDCWARILMKARHIMRNGRRPFGACQPMNSAEQHNFAAIVAKLIDALRLFCSTLKVSVADL